MGSLSLREGRCLGPGYTAEKVQMEYSAPEFLTSILGFFLATPFCFSLFFFFKYMNVNIILLLGWELLEARS